MSGSVRRGVAVVVGLAMLAGCTTEGDRSEGDRSADAGDPIEVGGGWSAEGLPALAGTDASGPVVPLLEGVELDGSLGLSTSTVPVLVMADPPAGATSFVWTVTDLSGVESVFSTTTSDPRVRVADEALVDGGTYVWSVEATGGGEGATAGPFVVNVDTQREGRQPALSPGGVMVAAVSGEPMWGWQSPRLRVATGDVGWGVSYRPSSPATAGLPSPWRLQVAGPSWERLEVQPGGAVGLRSRVGTTVTFREQAEGSYEAVWGEGQSWPSGQFSTLVRNADGTWSVTDLNRVVTTFGATDDANPVAMPTSVWSADSAQLDLEYVDGRLTALVDQVSGREMMFIYGGSDDCPVGGGDGFVDTPDGLLCGVRAWDGSTTVLRYVSVGDDVQLGRVTAFSGTGQSAQVTDFAYDASGRLSGVRNPLAAAVVASGAVDGLGDQDERALTQIAYDEEGRVVSVTAPAPLVTRGVAADPSQTQRASWTVSYEAPGVTALSQVGVTPPSGFIRKVVADPATMLVSTSTNASGATETTTWDVASSSPTSFIADNGLVSRTTYNEAGLAVEQRGPIAPGLIDSDAAPIATARYDEEFTSNPDGTPYTGLAVTYWANQQFTGTPAAADTGPSFDDTVPGSLAFNWPASPTGSSGWSARLSGKVTVAEEGSYQFTAGGTARLWVNGLACDPDCVQELAEGEASIRVDVATGDDVTGIDVQWAPPGQELAPLPTSVLRPGYNLIAAQTVVDSLSLTDTVPITSKATYDDPATERIVEMASSSGLAGSRTYEPFNPEAGDWARPTGYTDPSGAVSSVDYWGDDEEATPSCDGAARANQAGLRKLVTHPGGALPQLTTYDDAGRVVSTSISNGPATCFTYDPSGRPLTVSFASVDGAPAVEVSYDYATGNNPMVSTTTTTVDGDSRVSQVVVDLLGRPVQTTDVWGTVTSTTYDPVTGGVAASVARTAGGQSATSAFTYNTDGTLASASADGVLMSTYDYDSSGRMTQIILGDGTVGTTGYDALGHLESLTWKSPDGSVRSTNEVFASSGRLLQRSLTGPDGTSTYTYGYDLNGRLIEAVLDTPLEVSARNWSYEFDGAEGAVANRTAQVVDGRRITYSYDDQHRLTATDDPMLAGEITYDSRGNTTRLGPLTLTYTSVGQLASATDGDTTIEMLTDGVSTIGQRVTTSAGTSEVRFGSAGLQLDTEGQVIGRSVVLAPGVTVRTSPDGPTTWSLPDLRGNATWKVSGSETSSTTLYDPFGQLLNTTGAAEQADAAESDDAVDVAESDEATASDDAVDAAESDEATASDDAVDAAESATAPAGAELPDAGPDFGWHGASGVNTLPLTVALMEMGARTYVPALGRFLQVDPVVNGGANPYAYTNGDPINGHDMTGTTDKWWAVALGAVAAVAVGAIIGIATAGVGTGIGAAIGWGIVAAAVGGAVGEVTTELINTGHVDIKQVGFAVAIDVAFAVISFGVARGVTNYLRAGAGRAGPVASNVEARLVGEVASLDESAGLLSGGGRTLSLDSNVLTRENSFLTDPFEVNRLPDGVHYSFQMWVSPLADFDGSFDASFVSEALGFVEIM